MNSRLSILIVCSGNKGKINPFISEQAEAIRSKGVLVYYFTIQGKGLWGYVKSYFRFLSFIRKNKFDLIHAHYGLSGLLATFQRKMPVVITFHGSDVNNRKVLWFSRWAARRSAFQLVVEKSFLAKLNIHSNALLVPCGVDMNVFVPVGREEARTAMRFGPDEKIVLFTSTFSNPVKNYPLAAEAVGQLEDTALIELKGYSRCEINLLMNAADSLLLTSFSEGSPQVVKEALACNLPVVSTDVGDVLCLIEGIPGNFIVPFDAAEIAGKLKIILTNRQRVNGRSKIKSYDNDLIAEKIIAVYKLITGKK